MIARGFTIVELIVVIIALGLLATRSRNRNTLRVNDLFTRRINGPGGTPDTCVYYVVSDALIDQRPANVAIDPRYPAIVYTPGDGRVVAIEP